MEAITSEFFDATRPLHHLVNIFSERISPHLSKHCDRIWDNLGKFAKMHYRKNVNRLAGIKTHYILQAILFNTDGQPHKDV